MTGFGSHGPPDDPSNRPTRIASYNSGDLPPSASDEPPEYAEAAEPAETPQPEGPPDPWYRKRVLLVAWATVVAILVVLIIYGLIQLSHGNEGGQETTTPSTTATPSSTPSGSTTTSPTTEPSTTPPEPSSTPEEQPPPNGNAPPPAQAPPSAQPPEHHHHLPHIPPTISLPHTVITLPHGF